MWSQFRQGPPPDLLVFPSRLVPVIGPGLLAASWLMFAARPLSAMGSPGVGKLLVALRLSPSSWSC